MIILIEKVLWNALKIYGMGGQLMEVIKASYREGSAGVKVDGELSDRFTVGVGEGQGCVVLLCLLNIFMEVCMREMQA